HRDAFLPRLAVELVALMSGRHDRQPDVQFGQAREIHIDTPAGAAPVAHVADGDGIGQTPDAVTIRPSSMNDHGPHGARSRAVSARPTSARAPRREAVIGAPALSAPWPRG